MPRIKSPISQTERDYNKRYDFKTQQFYVDQIRNSLTFHANADEYKLQFLVDINYALQRGWDLNERQADFLVELYNRYSE